MKPPRHDTRQIARLLVLVLAAAGTAFLLVYAISTTVVERDTPDLPAGPALEYDAIPPGAPGTPYAAVDPALLAALNSYEQPDPLAVLAPGVPPIGVYLPLTGDTQFALPTPIPTVTHTPSATATPPPTGTPQPTHTLPPSETPRPTHTPGPTQPPTFTPPPTTDPTDAAFLLQIANCAPYGWPASGRLTQYYRWYHRAIDFAMPQGTGVVATHSGVVRFAGWRTDGYGNLIILESGRFITYYAHLSDFAVYEGQIVTQGTVIGWSGNTGNSSGPHIHYEIRIDDQEVDPLTFDQRGHAAC